MERTPEQVLVYNYFPKYNILKEMTMAAFAGSTAEAVNIYIDITRMVANLYDPGVKILHPLSIASTILNLCAHLRTYYDEFHKVDTKFFLVYSNLSNTYNCNLIPDYNRAHFERVESDKVTSNAIAIAMNALKELVPYIPGIYYKEDIYEAMAIIYDMIHYESSMGNNDPNIIITKDPLVYQVPAMLDNTVIFRDNKFSGTFSVIAKQNAIVGYLYDTDRRKTITDPKNIEKISHISSELLGTLITLTNLPSRGVKSLFDINKAITTLDKIISQGQILNGYVNDTNYLYSCIFNGLSKVSLEMFILRYKAIDIISNWLHYCQTPYAMDRSYKIDLNDPEAVQAINNEYFKDTPIDLNRL